MHAIDQLMWLLRFDNNCGNNMHYFLFDLKNYYASAKAAVFKFLMGTASLMHNQALWGLYVAIDKAD